MFLLTVIGPPKNCTNDSRPASFRLASFQEENRSNEMLMKTSTLILSSAAAAILSVLPVQAIVIGGGVTSGTGIFKKLTVPFTESDPDNTVGDDTFQDPNLYAFDEDQNVAVGPGALSADLVPGGGHRFDRRINDFPSLRNSLELLH